MWVCINLGKFYPDGIKIFFPPTPRWCLALNFHCHPNRSSLCIVLGWVRLVYVSIYGNCWPVNFEIICPWEVPGKILEMYHYKDWQPWNEVWIQTNIWHLSQQTRSQSRCIQSVIRFKSVDSLKQNKGLVFTGYISTEQSGNLLIRNL